MNMMMVMVVMVMVTMVIAMKVMVMVRMKSNVKPRIVSSQLLKEGPVDGKEPTWAFYKCVTFKQRTVIMLIIHSLLNTNTWRSLSVN